MAKITLCRDSLVLYKNRPARVTRIGKKLEIELPEAETLSVRVKDVTPLHPGPVGRLDRLKPPPGEVETAWELLSGNTTHLVELAELVYGAYTPTTAWGVWQLLDDGLYFDGTPEEIVAHAPETVAQEQKARAAKAARVRAWRTFLTRAEAGEYAPQDKRLLRGVEALALGQRETSRVLRELGRSERPENAHALLLELGYWDSGVNPYPQRFGLEMSTPDMALPALPEETRVDLTHLLTLAIDDEGSHDPDDALSLEDGRLWVHIADAAALVPPDSPAERLARARGANLYLPEGTVPMLPPEATQRLGLGLNETSPALSFGLDLNAAGEVVDVEIVPSWVRVTRLTYKEANARLDEAPLAGLYRLARDFQARRLADGAAAIDLPEVRIRVKGEKVVIRPILPLRSRELVGEAMLMLGAAVARFAIEREIPFPFATQDVPPTREQPQTLSEMYALMRTFSRSQMQSTPAPHGGVGLEAYCRVTSPLRRYVDLLAHQQLRAFIQGAPLLDEGAVVARIGETNAVSGAVRQVERLSNKHWTLVYLSQHPDWRGEGVLVEMRGTRGNVLIPELALEADVHLRQELPLDSQLTLTVSGVDLPELEAHLRVVK